MGLEVETTAPGAAALAALDRAVAAVQGTDPLAPVTVVVPTNGVGVATRRALARRRPIGNVEFLTLPRLAERLGRGRLTGRRPLSVPLLEAALRATLTEAPGRFHDVADHAATVAALRAAYRAVRELPEPVRLAVEHAGSPLGRDTVRIVTATHHRLHHQWFDVPDVVRAAIEALGSDPAAGGAVPPPVVVHLPERDDPLAATLVARLAQSGDVRVVAALTGDSTADADVVTWLGRLGWVAPPSGPIASGAVSGATVSGATVSTLHVDVVSTSDPDDEVRAARREVVDAMRAGTPLHRIAVVWCAPDPYARLVTDHLRAAGITFHGTDPVSVAERVAGRAVLGLLDVDRLDWRREDVFAVLGSAPFTLPSGQPLPTAAWERLSREAKVHGGTQWETRLAPWRDDLLERAEAATDDAAAVFARRLAAQADALRGFVADLADDLGPRRHPLRWAEWVRRTHRLMERYLGGDALRAALEPAEQRAFDRVQAALDRLGDLDAVAAPVDRVLFRDALAAELETDLGRAGVPGTGVLAGPLGSLTGADLDLVVMVGASDAALPGAVPFDPLLTDRDRRVAGGLLAAPDSSLRRQRRAFAGALASVGHVVVTVPRGDLRQTADRRPSPWLADLVPTDSRHHREVASFGAGVEWTTFPPTPQEHRLRSVARHVRAGHPLDDHPLALVDPALARSLHLLRARSSVAFTPYDGNLSSLTLPPALDPTRPLSATRVERWASCPHRFLMEDLLRVGVVENPEDVLTITALDKGSLLHAVLDRFHREVLAGSLPMPAPSEPWPDAHRRRLLAIFDEAADRAEQAGLTGRPTLWRRTRRLLAVHLVRWLARDDEERAGSGFTPIASETHFGFGDGWPAAAVTLPDGRVAMFRGSIDRVDRDPGGGYRVIDHKSGKRSRFDKLETTVHEGGTKLQLLLYAAAVRTAMADPDLRVRAEYSFLEEQSGRRTIGYEVDATRQAALATALGVIVSGIEHGVFPAHPAAPGFRVYIDCPYCDPDGLGTATRYREWTAKRADPALAGFVALREPDDATVSSTEVAG